MTTVTGLTAERMLEIEAASVVDGDVVGNDLFLTRKDGSLINAGNVRGGPGPTGPMGSPLTVVTAQQLFDVGQPNQIRAGRQLAAADFTNMGLSAPLGLWNLSNFSDSSGNGRTLTNHGAVPLGVGINGIASTAAVFNGLAGQSLYIADTGAADPFRIRAGSWGAWFKTSRRGANQRIISKMASPGAISDVLFDLYVTSTNVLSGQGFAVTAGAAVNGTTDVADDRWHFAVVTADGARLVIYLDGAQEAAVGMPAHLLSATFGPVNIGNGADAGAGGIANIALYGRVDEAFITSDVLSLDQIRNLYSASVPHALGSVPTITTASVRRRRRGGVLAVTDFPSTPLRLHNFTAGVLTDQGSHNLPLAIVSGTNTVPAAAGDGARSGAYSFAGSHTGLGASDAGLPSGLATRSFGVWVKTASVAGATIMGWGTLTTGDTRIIIGTDGQVAANNVSDVIGASGVINDGNWHFVVMVEDNAAVDGVKRKLYLDGRLRNQSLGLSGITLIGANGFRVGANSGGTGPFTGVLDAPFVFNGALTSEQIRKIYDIGSQVLAPSPRTPSDHIRAVETGRLLVTFDTLETVDTVDLVVM